MKKCIITLLIICTICVCIVGCTENTEGYVFGTFYSTEISSSSASSDTEEVVFALTELDNIFSTSISGSTVDNINNAESGKSVAIDTEFLYIWDLAVSLSELTSVFNPWYFPLVELWGFSPTTYTGVATSIPTDAEIQETLAYCSADCFVVDVEAMTITKTDSRAKIDFGAFLKGYAVDVAVGIVYDSTEYLINVGGTIATNRTLSVMVTNPRGSGYVASFTLDNEAVATSGDYERYYIYDDVRYSHIISSNGYPTTVCGDDMPISVTVVGESATYCDTLSTVIMILGEDATELVESLGYSALIITENSYYTMGDKSFEIC